MKFGVAIAATAVITFSDHLNAIRIDSIQKQQATQKQKTKDDDMLLFTTSSGQSEDISIGEDELPQVTDHALNKRLEKINELIQQTSQIDIDETKNTFQTVTEKGDMLEAAMKRAEEQREKDEKLKSLAKEKEMIQNEKQKRLNNNHYASNWDNNFKQMAEAEVNQIVDHALAMT